MKKSVLGQAIVALFSIVGSANALVMDSFENTTSGNTETSSTGNGNWVNVHYTGVGIYNNSTRLIAGRAGHSNGYNLSVNPTTGVFTGSGGSADGAYISYGTGVKSWFDKEWTPQPFGTKPSVTTANQSLQLNISAALTDSFYFNSGATGFYQIGFFDSNASLLNTLFDLNAVAGLNTVTLSSFVGLTSLEASDIDGIKIFMNGDNSVSEVGFNIASQAAAVPEPETFAMFLAGLGLMGFVARRRKA